MRTKHFSFLTGMIGAAVFSTPAAATVVFFNFVGDASYSFSLDQSPTPDLVRDGEFTVFSVPATINGNAEATDVYFYPANAGGGIALVSDGSFITGSGAQLFSGPASAPTFLTGRYEMLAYFEGVPGTGTLTIGTSPGGGVPEPASWAMLIAGFGLVGATMRRRRTLAAA